MKNLPAFFLSSFFLFCFLLSSCSALLAQKDSLQNTVSVTYDHTHFDKQFADDWQVGSLEYKRRTVLGSVLGRLNYANRFEKRGWQAEVESYPVISNKLYAFAGLSYAENVPVFSKWRAGATLYYNFAKGWEAEGGFRYLYFAESLWIGTAGISKYAGAWLFNARSFFSIHSPLGNQSFFLKGQRFLKNERDYIWLQVGSGVSPDESRNIQLNTVANLVSKRLTAGARFSVSRQIQLTLTAGYASDEYRVKVFGNQYNGTAGISVGF